MYSVLLFGRDVRHFWRELHFNTTGKTFEEHFRELGRWAEERANIIAAVELGLL
jgi:hypothetical protein